MEAVGRRTSLPADGSLELKTFIVQLGAAMNAVSEPVYSIEQRLVRVASAYGAGNARVSAFPTSLILTLGSGESATLEPTTPVVGPPRLDQIAALHLLVHDAQLAAVTPTEGLRRLDEIRELKPRFGRVASILGYAILAVGICLILHPSPRDLVITAFFGTIVGLLRLLGERQPTLQILMPVLAAFVVAALTALAVKHDWADPGLRSMIAALIVFLPGSALTTAVLELAAGEMIAGASRLVWASVQLFLLAFGILAGVEAIGITASRAFSSSSQLLGAWAPWLGVLVFAAGVLVANSAPTNSFLGLVVVLYAAWIGQVIGNHLFGGFVSGFVGALVMTPVAYFFARRPGSMPAYATFLPGFWLLVPGAIGLIGVTTLAGTGSATAGNDFKSAVASTIAVALGVLCGTQLHESLNASSARVNRVWRSDAPNPPATKGDNSDAP
jgi:uncharacterized membrane protein YjjP (DUF1212 family)